MRSPVDTNAGAGRPQKISSNLTQASVLAAVGLILFIFESLIPRPLPWLKPGLANLATVVALYICGFRLALFVTLIRVLLGALILGTFMSPGFVLAFTAGLAATLAMAIVWQLHRGLFSIIGLSLVGAVVHSTTQLFIAAIIIVADWRVLELLPIMVLSSLFSGFLVGILAHYMAVGLERVIRA